MLLFVHSRSNHLDGDERAGCFALFVLLVSRNCCMALPHDGTVCLQFGIVVFPDRTHYFFYTLIMCNYSSVALTSITIIVCQKQVCYTCTLIMSNYSSVATQVLLLQASL